MDNPWEGQAFLFMWIGFLLLMSGGIALLFFWGVRAGQFSDQQRARSLALTAEIPDSLPPRQGDNAEPGRGKQRP